MMRKFKLLSLAALAAFAIAACDEGGTNVQAVEGTITGTVASEGTGLQGVTVSLSSGASTATDGSGRYTFNNVPAGNYVVEISGLPSDATFSSTAKTAVIAAAGQVVTVDFSGSFVRTSAIVGGVAVAEVGPLENVTVTLGGDASQSTTTDAAGQYSFTGLRAGSYTVTISGFDATLYTFPSTTQSATVGVGATEVLSFAGTQIATAVVSGRLFLDENDKNNVFDGEALENNLEAADITVILKGPEIGVVQSTVTDEMGMFEFTELVAGSYSVSIDSNDADIPSWAVFGGDTTDVVLPNLATGAVGTANFPFDIIEQTVTVCSWTGVDSVNPGVAPVSDSEITLYPTELDLVGGTNAFATDTTDASGCVGFTFERADDTSPQPGFTDNIVFADYEGNPNGLLTLNGEGRIEVRYDPTSRSSLAPDTFDLLNSQVVIAFDARSQLPSDTLSGWNWASWLDTTQAARFNGQTDANAVGMFTDTIGPASLPVTYFVRLAEGIGSQPAPAGNQIFAQTPFADEGGTAARYLTYTHDGTQGPADTTFLGTEEIRFTTADIVVSIHHETDDSTDVPTFTGGDDISNVDEVAVTLWRLPSDGSAPDSIDTMNPTGGLNTVTFGMQPTDTSFAVTARWSGLGGPKKVLMDTLQVIPDSLWGGVTYSASPCPLEGGMGCSTFAYKYENTEITGLVRAADGTDADGIQVRIMPTSDNIQPTLWGVDADLPDTTVVVSGGGYGIGGLTEGPYDVMVFDSIDSNGDTIWAYFGDNPPRPDSVSGVAQPWSADLTGNADDDIINFTMLRMDTKILGSVVNDRDGDGNVIDIDEALGNVTLNLYKDSISAATLHATTTSNGNGNFAFEKLREGAWVIEADGSSALTSATVLANLTAAGTPETHLTVTTGATTTNLGLNLTRVVGDTIPGTPGMPALAFWNYDNSSVGFNNPSHFTFLFNNTSATGTIVDGGGNAVSGATVTLRRCRMSAGSTSPPTSGSCTSYLPDPPQNVSTDASGKFTFTDIQEGVYEVTPNPVTAGFTTSFPASLLYRLVDNGDVETPAGNIVFN